MSEREKILDEAKKCVCGHREQDYGSPENNFRVIAKLWTGYLGDTKLNLDSVITPLDVSMMMALLKIARIRSGGGSGDSFVDLAGYAACGGEIFSKETKINLDSCSDEGKVPSYKTISNGEVDGMNLWPTIDKDLTCEKVRKPTKPTFHCVRCKYFYVSVDQNPCNECCFRSGIQTEKYDSKFKPE